MIKPTMRAQNAQRTREQLLEAASTLFDQHGYSAVTVNDICERAGLTKGAFYHHFKSKEEIQSYVFTPQLDVYLKEHYGVAPDATAYQMLYEVASCTYQFSQHHEALFTRESIVLLLHRTVSTLYAPNRLHNQLLRAAFRRAQDEGNLLATLNENEGVMMYASMMIGFLVKWSTYDTEREPPIDWDKLLFEMVHRLFQPV